MKPIISIVGKSDSGKTTFLEGLIAELKRRGYRVGVMKHSVEDVELDIVNKDTWRFTRAGSDVSAISSGQKLAIFKRLEQDPGPEELSRLISNGFDLLLTEGFKKGSYPKIEVHRKDQGKDLVSPPGQLLAVVTDEPLEVNAPQFSKADVSQVADLIEKRMLTQQAEVDLLVNGAHVPLDSAGGNLLTRTLVAIITGLKGIKDITSLQVSLRRKS